MHVKATFGGSPGDAGFMIVPGTLPPTVGISRGGTPQTIKIAM
jgi:hypothetical protein